MNTHSQKIDDIISEVITEKTFSLEIVEKIKSLRDDFGKEVTKNETLEKTNADLISANNNLGTQVSKLTAEVQTFKVRETSIAEKEKMLEKNEYELIFQKQRAEEIKQLFGIVFKNPTIRETVYRNSTVPVANNGYVQSMSGSENENKTVETE